jgi:hypothetical protein
MSFQAPIVSLAPSSIDTTSSRISKNSQTANAPRIDQIRRTWQHSPIVVAMLTGNTMNSCDDVLRLHAECIVSGSRDRICDAAATSFLRCMDKQRTSFSSWDSIVAYIHLDCSGYHTTMLLPRWWNKILFHEMNFALLKIW